MSALSYIPAENEKAYFLALFQVADVQRTGNIGGAQAVAFFARAKLPVDVLKNIWTVADQPSTSSLNIPKFAVAVRLIQLTQNGQKGQGPNLAAPPGVVLRPPFFEGVSGVSVPLPPAPTGGLQPPPQQPQSQLSPSQQQLSPPPHQPQQHQQLPHQHQQHHLQAPPTPSRPNMQPQLQVPPTPSRQGMQPQLQAPPTPARGQQGMPPTSPNGGGSTAIVPQDPYSLPPAEKGRYESLFAQYAKDGYLYGREAVELFSKSGVNQAVLRDIWNMVDYPVDNRLDKLEFALAMHLIVCISKKNLPVPPNGLPISLKMLKQQQRDEEQAQPPPTPAPQQPPQGQSFGNTSHTGGGPPQHQQVQIPSPAPLQMNGGFQGKQEANHNRMSSFQSDAPHSHAGGMQMSSGPSYNPPTVDRVPPPLTGGTNISDAFEGLDMGGGDMSSLPSYVPEPEPQRSQPEPYVAPSLAPRQMASVAHQAPAPAMHMAPDPPKSTQALAANYNMGDNVQELEKLRSVLQRLQAENISLKAHLGSMSEEEKEVQKELGATVAEIGTLSNSLIGLRQQVLTAKTNLMEASSELKAAREKKGVILDMISEFRETKAAIEEATALVQKAKDVALAPVNVSRQADVFGGDLFGFESSSPSAAPVETFDDSGDDDSMKLTNEDNMEAPDPVPHQNAYSAAREPVAVSQDMSAPATAPSLPAVTTVESSDMSGGQEDTEHEEMFSRPPPEAPGAMFGHHSRRDSNPFASDLVMGGAPPPNQTISPLATTFSNASNFEDEDEDDREGQDGEDLRNVDEIKRKLVLAEETARDASVAHRKLMAEYEELRRDVEQAEAHARTLKAQAEETKRGTFGGGKKKKLTKEAENAAADAEDIKKRFTVVQKQSNDAQSVVMETKREVDKLRNEAEQAELDAVQMASLREQEHARRKEEQEAKVKSLSPQPPPNGFSSYDMEPNGASFVGYGAPLSAPVPSAGGYGQPMGQGPSGYGAPAIDQAQNMYGGFSHQQGGMMGGMGGFGGGVMAGGGDDRFDLPSPDQLPTGQNAGGYTNAFDW